MSDALERIRTLLGPAGWLAPEDAAAYADDIARRGAPPLLVARPASTEEVAGVVRICAEAGIAVVPQGGNTNVCGMAVPLPGQRAVVVSLGRMSRVLSVEPAREAMACEAGCPLQTLQEAARAAGRTFAPDWGARGTATAGGAVATNGGGLNVLRYGTTREQVLGMEAVLPDGTVWDGMRALVKDNSGYDLKHLFIGSEGTLGIVTKLVFRLHPLQPDSRSAMAVLADMDRLMEFFAMARERGGERLTAFELMPGIGLDKALERNPALRRPLEARADWYVLVRYSGRAAVDGELAALLEEAFAAGLLADGVMAASEAQERNLWAVREHMIPHGFFDRRMVKWDVSVPVDRMVEFLARAKEAARAVDPGAIPYAVGHVGDGNVHFSVFPEGPERAGLDDVCARLTERIDALVWSLGGSIVAEHGVGSLFVGRVRRQKGAVEYAMMQRLKAAFDPAGIMNPGKLIAPD